MANKFPSIPTPTRDIAGLFDTVSALKHLVDGLSGLDGKGNAPSNTYVQRDTPSGMKNGDLWLRPPLLAGEVFQTSIAIAGKWIRLPALTETIYTSSLAANVGIFSTSTYYTGPSLNVGNTGLWLVAAVLTCQSNDVGTNCAIRISDGVNLYIATAYVTCPAASQPWSGTAVGIIRDPKGILLGQASSSISSNSQINAGFSYMQAIRIG